MKDYSKYKKGRLKPIQILILEEKDVIGRKIRKMEINKAPWLRGTFLFSSLKLVDFISKEDFIWKKLEKTSFVRVGGWKRSDTQPT